MMTNGSSIDLTAAAQVASSTCACSSGEARAAAGKKPRAPWPFSTYLVSPRYRFIYCPIPKNACSSLKVWYLRTQGMDRNDPDWPEDVHEYCATHGMRDPADLERGYFKFIFVRNPWHRLVSGYVQKFLGNYRHPQSPSRLVVDEVYRSRGLAPDYEKSITFREFVDYVEAREDLTLDFHWRSQHLFLGDIAFDFVGRVENLAVDFAKVVERLGTPELGLAQENRTSYGDQVFGCVADWPATELRALPRTPHYRHFYPDDLRERVARRYARDIELFGYAFE